MLVFQVTDEVALVVARQVCGTFGAAHEVAAQQGVELVAGPPGLVAVQQVDGALDDLACAEPGQRLELPQLLRPLVVQYRIDSQAESCPIAYSELDRSLHASRPRTITCLWHLACR